MSQGWIRYLEFRAWFDARFVYVGLVEGHGEPIECQISHSLHAAYVKFIFLPTSMSGTRVSNQGRKMRAVKRSWKVRIDYSDLNYKFKQPIS